MHIIYKYVCIIIAEVKEVMHLRHVNVATVAGRQTRVLEWNANMLWIASANREHRP